MSSSQDILHQAEREQELITRLQHEMSDIQHRYQHEMDAKQQEIDVRSREHARLLDDIEAARKREIEEANRQREQQEKDSLLKKAVKRGLF